MRRFIAKTEGQTAWLRELCEQYANDQWVAVHMTGEQVAESVLECFRSVVMQELNLLELQCAQASNS